MKNNGDEGRGFFTLGLKLPIPGAVPLFKGDGLSSKYTAISRLWEKVLATIQKGIVGGFSLFFKEICKNGTRDHELMFAIAKGKQQM